MRRHLTLAAGLLASSALSACRALTVDDFERLAPEVVAIEAVVERGTTVVLSLVNESLLGWDYFACPGGFERFEGGQWVEMPSPSVACLGIITTIGGEQTKSVGMWVRSDYPNGTYRTIVRFGRDGGEVFRRSNTFEVVAAAAGGAPTVSVMANEVMRGQDFSVLLGNAGAAEYGFNLCSGGRLEARIDGAWVEEGEPLRLCTEELQVLAAGSEATSFYSIPLSASTGTYRLRVRFYGESGAPVTAHSNTFTVR